MNASRTAAPTHIYETMQSKMQEIEAAEIAYLQAMTPEKFRQYWELKRPLRHRPYDFLLEHARPEQLAVSRTQT